MKKDIIIPEVKDVYVAAIEETNEEGEKNWWVYLINDTSGPLENVIINSKGYSDLESKGGKITAALRKQIKVLPAKSAAKLEPIMPEVFDLFNEYWVMFFEQESLKDRRYIFGPQTIDTMFTEDVPLMNRKGVLIR
jgi:hypothetical protein